MKKRKKSDEVKEEDATNGTNGDAAKKPHIEGEVATNGHSNGNWNCCDLTSCHTRQYLYFFLLHAFAFIFLKIEILVQ